MSVTVSWMCVRTHGTFISLPPLFSLSMSLVLTPPPPSPGFSSFHTWKTIPHPSNRKGQAIQLSTCQCLNISPPVWKITSHTNILGELWLINDLNMNEFICIITQVLPPSLAPGEGCVQQMVEASRGWSLPYLRKPNVFRLVCFHANLKARRTRRVVFLILEHDLWIISTRFKL